MKAVIFDIDWVIVTNTYSFYNHLVSHYMANKNDMDEFFRWDLRKCSIWEKDLKNILPKYLSKCNWNLWVENFLNLWFLSEAKTDRQVLELAQVLNERWILCCIWSNQEQYRKEFLLHTLWLWNIFEKNYFSCELWVRKPDKMFYEKVIIDLGLDAEEILVIDDDEKNLVSAKELWMETILYKDFGDIEHFI